MNLPFFMAVGRVLPSDLDHGATASLVGCACKPFGPRRGNVNAAEEQVFIIPEVMIAKRLAQGFECVPIKTWFDVQEVFFKMDARIGDSFSLASLSDCHFRHDLKESRPYAV